MHLLCAECKITAGHWPITDHFSKMANQISAWYIPFIHMANQVHKSGRPFHISYFAVCTHTSMHLDMRGQYDGILYSLADLHGRFPGLLCTCGLESTYTDMDCVFLV